MNFDLILSALIGGLIAAVVSPFFKYFIEIKTTKRTEQKELINRLRTYIVKEDCQSTNFLKSVDYNRIRPYLNKSFVVMLEDMSETIINLDTVLNQYEYDFLQEIDRIEIEWNLALSKKRKI